MICPFCAEEIKDEAVVCRFCRKELLGKTDVTFSLLDAGTETHKSKSNKRTNIIIAIITALVISLAVFYFTSSSGESRELIVNGALTQFKDEKIVISESCKDINKAKEIIVKFYSYSGGLSLPQIEEEWVLSNRECFNPIIIAYSVL